MRPVSPDKGLHNHPDLSYLSVANGKSVMNPDTFFFFLHLRLSTHLSLSLDKKGCGSPMQKISLLLLCIALAFHYLCPRIGSVSSDRANGLKGNRVKVPNSPAAVKLQFQLTEKTYATDVAATSGRFRQGSQSEDLPSFILDRPPGLGRPYEA